MRGSEPTCRPARTGAGRFGLSNDPPAAVTVTGRAAPALNGISGLVSTAFTQDSAADMVDANGALRLRRTCGAVPVKSTAIVSSRTVTVARRERGVTFPIVVHRGGRRTRKGGAGGGGADSTIEQRSRRR